MTNKLITNVVGILLSGSIMASSPIIVNEINSNWKVHEAGSAEWLNAKVPGCIHTDLLDNKKIEDPFYRTNEENMQWIGEKDWEYATTFKVEKATLAKDKVEIVFQGIDTYADVYLNNELILSSDNMHRTWRVDCKSKLKEGDNSLRVYIYSIFKKALPLMKSSPFPLFQFANNDQADTMVSIYVRKAGYHFGWDWGPRLVTAGIWRPVTLEAFDAAKIDGVQIITKSISSEKAAMFASVEVLALKSENAEITINEGNTIVVKKQVAVTAGLNKIGLDFEITNPKLWWSNGLGKANLYTFVCQLSLDKKITDEQSITTGIRTIKVIAEKDKLGKSLYLVLNGVPVFMKGANYIPSDNFTNRFTDSAYEYTVKSAADANMNMLRLWGGGYFEKDIFYNLCDKYGILIWHDMLFACGTYPGNDEYYKSVTAEIKDNVKRIRNHPSIAMWNGNNEVEVAYNQWGWKEKLSKDDQVKQEDNMKKLFYDVIPSAIYSEDSTRYYHPTSPNTGYKDIPMNMGDVHYWSVWHGKEPFESYNTNVGRFMSEYGFQSYPELASVKKFTLPEDRTLDSKVMKSHQRCMADDRKDMGYGNRLIKHYMDQYYKEPKDFESYLYVSQILQSKGVKIAVEAHRRNMPKCMGTLYWQINDCWPVASWASIDYYGQWKALHYKAREIYKEQLVAPIIENGKLNTYVVSDRLSPIDGMLQFTLSDLSGKIIWKKDVKANIPINTSVIASEMDTAALYKGISKTNSVLKIVLLENNKELASNIFYFVPEKELNLSKPKIDMEVSKVGNLATIKLKTDVLAKDVCISLPDAEGFFSYNYFDLLPGDSKTITYSCKSDLAKITTAFKAQSLIDTY